MATSGCCPTLELREPPVGGLTGDPTPFLRRLGLLVDVRGPIPTFDDQAAKSRTLPLARPLPQAELVWDRQGDPAPDRGRSRPWPG
jgi:hypothetical protein